EELYEKLLADFLAGDESSPVFTHHIAYVNKNRAHYRAPGDYALEQPDFIVSDYIASMTDDYFLELYRHLFPNSSREIRFRSYFD
ncbi:MAG: phosphohydrolase, partial [Lachnospiraceae bacterium]|nr:phosphohydrolase [Lachnospiraceae bacterium]